MTTAYRMLQRYLDELIERVLGWPPSTHTAYLRSLILEEQRRLRIVRIEEEYEPPSDHGVTGARPLPPMRIPETFLDDLPWHEQNRRINDLLMREKTE